MTSKISIKLVVCLLALAVLPAKAQSLEHPVIWTTAGDKASILELVDTYPWATSIVSKLHSSVDDKVNTHLSNPSSILSTIPAIPADDNLSESEATTNGAHSKVLNYASYAGLLYYLTGEEKYAQFSADILSYYIDILALRTPTTTTICGNTFYDPRASYGQFAIAYDFIQPFLKKTDTKVYVKSSGTKVAFDNVKAQKAVYNIAMNALQESDGADTKYGSVVSNHPVLRAPGVLFSILCVEDDAERERMFEVFWNKGTKEQNSFTKTILPMFGDQGIWPESVSYSFMQNITLVLNLVDRLKPELNVMNGNMHILDGNFLFDNLRHPNQRFVRYGDSHRDNDGTASLYRYTLNMAKRKGYTDYEQKAKVALRQSYNTDGGYDPVVPITTYGNYYAFEQLLWGVDVPQIIEGEIDFQKPTVIIKHAGVALQRNYVEENNEDYGLCGIIGGAHYVHSHCTGITMELYGANYIMAANAGLPPSLAERKIPEHTDYFWRHAGNNTMIVNGTTHGIQTGAWNSDSYLWMNTTVNVAAEPQHLEDPVSDNFSFATQFLDDKVNNDQQQRTLSTIRTSSTTGYYFDLFRSKSLGTNNFHDYIYHNLGDVTHIFDEDGEEMSVSATTRYQNDIGDARQSPGWRFFEETKVTDTTDAAVHVRFDLDETNTYMNMFVPAGQAREYTRAVGPATREAKGGYIDKKTQIIAVRQQGEAWNRPYVNVFEPSKSANTSVQSVEHLYRGDVIVGAKVMSQIGAKSVVDYVICQEDASKAFTLAEEDISFTGRFAVIRKEQNITEAQLTLYIGEGDSLSFGAHSLKAGADKKGVLVQPIEADLSRVLGFKDYTDGQEIAKGTNLSLEAFVGTDFTEVTLWGNETTNLGTLTEAPYVWASHALLTDMQDAYYTFKLVAKDAQGQEDVRFLTLRTPGQWAYTIDGKPHAIPGTIQFEHYDNGGKDIAYWDKLNQNASSFRPDEMVDISSDGTIVRDIKSGEWLEFTIDVPELSYYDLAVRHQTRRSPEFKQLTVLLPDEGKTFFSDVILTNTGSGSYKEENIGAMVLEPGVHVLRFQMLDYGFDVDYFTLAKAADVFTVNFSNGSSMTSLYTQSDSTCQFPLTPTQSDSIFAGWQTIDGQVVEASTLITEDVTLFATWAEKSYSLQTTATNGSISISPEQDTYEPNAQITLTAIPDDGYEFVDWSGDYVGTENPLSLTMSEDMEIIANFQQQATGLTSSKVKQILVTPNPNDGIFTIQCEGEMYVNYKLYSLNGVIVQRGVMNAQKEIVVDSPMSGVYMLEVTSDTNREVLKVIIK